MDNAQNTAQAPAAKPMDSGRGVGRPRPASTTELWKRVEFALDPVASFDSGARDALASLRTRMERMEAVVEAARDVEVYFEGAPLFDALASLDQEEAHA